MSVWSNTNCDRTTYNPTQTLTRSSDPFPTPLRTKAYEFQEQTKVPSCLEAWHYTVRGFDISARLLSIPGGSYYTSIWADWMDGGQDERTDSKCSVGPRPCQ